MYFVILALTLIPQQLSEPDIPLMLQAALVKVHQDLSHTAIPMEKRELFLDVTQTREAFQARLFPRLTLQSPLLRQAHVDKELPQVLSCSSMLCCVMEGNGVFVSVLSARRAAPSEVSKGDYVLDVRVRWTEASRGATSEGPVRGYDMEMFLARRAGRWEVVGYGWVIPA